MGICEIFRIFAEKAGCFRSRLSCMELGHMGMLDQPLLHLDLQPEAVDTEGDQGQQFAGKTQKYFAISFLFFIHYNGSISHPTDTPKEESL
jgi:hypothetical protein